MVSLPASTASPFCCPSPCYTRTFQVARAVHFFGGYTLAVYSRLFPRKTAYKLWCPTDEYHNHCSSKYQILSKSTVPMTWRVMYLWSHAPSPVLQEYVAVEQNGARAHPSVGLETASGRHWRALAQDSQHTHKEALNKYLREQPIVPLT